MSILDDEYEIAPKKSFFEIDYKLRDIYSENERVISFCLKEKCFRKNLLIFLTEIDKTQFLISPFQDNKKTINLLEKYFGNSLLNLSDLDSKQLYLVAKRKYSEGKSILGRKQ